MRHYKERENWRIYCWLSVRMLRKYRRHLLTRMNEEWEYVPVGSALMFWMRRAIDGTDQQFVDLFTKFYQGYNAEKYERNIDQRLFSAPKNLPFGEI